MAGQKRRQGKGQDQGCQDADHQDGDALALGVKDAVDRAVKQQGSSDIAILVPYGAPTVMED